MHIRDPRAAALARELSRVRGCSMTEAIIHALENELKRERERRPLSERLEVIARRLAAQGGPAHGRVLSKAEIDELWGQPTA